MATFNRLLGWVYFVARFATSNLYLTLYAILGAHHS
jgi:hypothetical protein